ncbi:hypothetical protein BAE44_0005777 [Dichanthelium oligosanthes]|uniref:CCHC-type domain-containing protein n=1 Tax=Dichanthelium oligosanthes TaxID=888268 RepID=A0A1E5W753_9POAL|nr:hypothetical protein BAE44_0005777 [Dichanthelium oligosanthes]
MAQRRCSRARRDPDLDDDDGGGSPPSRRPRRSAGSDDDDDEGNEDLSLDIVARSRRKQRGGASGGGGDTVSAGPLLTVSSGDDEERIPRYFDPGETLLETCFNCSEEGHVAANCPMEKRKKPCFVCGLFGHNAKQCTQVQFLAIMQMYENFKKANLELFCNIFILLAPAGQDCFICKKGGHMAKDCPDKHKTNDHQSTLCLRCGEIGHDMFGCTNDYPPDDIKVSAALPWLRMVIYVVPTSLTVVPNKLAVTIVPDLVILVCLIGRKAGHHHTFRERKDGKRSLVLDQLLMVPIKQVKGKAPISRIEWTHLGINPKLGVVGLAATISMIYRSRSTNPMGSVCSSWHAAYTGLRSCGGYRRPQSPCLFYTTDDEATSDNIACLYSLAEKRVYKLTLPEIPIRSRHLIGSSNGCLVTADERSELHIVNPITGDQIALPSVTTIEQVKPIFDDAGAIQKY